MSAKTAGDFSAEPVHGLAAQAVHLNPSPSGTPQPLPDLAPLKRLVSLDLSENLFLRVPARVSRLQALEDLTFRDNSRLTVRRGRRNAGSCMLAFGQQHGGL